MNNRLILYINSSLAGLVWLGFSSHVLDISNKMNQLKNMKNKIRDKISQLSNNYYTSFIVTKETTCRELNS